MSVETLILHPSDFIQWFDASGAQAGAPRTLPAQDLDVRLTRAPVDLKLVHKTAGTALWRRRPETLGVLVDGIAAPADMAAPSEPLYPLAGEVRDRAGHFLPRRFAFHAGRRAGHRLGLFRSPLGTRFTRAGGLHGRTTDDGGAAIAWALVRLSVSPPLAGTIDFLARSDERGEFRLSLERLPALTRDAPAATYPATLTVQAATDPDDPSDPDALPAARVRGTGDGDAAFKTHLTVDVAPGRIAPLTSPGRDALVLRLS